MPRGPLEHMEAEFHVNLDNDTLLGACASLGLGGWPQVVTMTEFFGNHDTHSVARMHEQPDVRVQIWQNMALEITGAESPMHLLTAILDYFPLEDSAQSLAEYGGITDFVQYPPLKSDRVSEEQSLAAERSLRQLMGNPAIPYSKLSNGKTAMEYADEVLEGMGIPAHQAETNLQLLRMGLFAALRSGYMSHDDINGCNELAPVTGAMHSPVEADLLASFFAAPNLGEAERAAFVGVDLDTYGALSDTMMQLYAQDTWQGVVVESVRVGAYPPNERLMRQLYEPRELADMQALAPGIISEDQRRIA